MGDVSLDLVVDLFIGSVYMVVFNSVIYLYGDGKGVTSKQVDQEFARLDSSGFFIAFPKASSLSKRPLTEVVLIPDVEIYPIFKQTYVYQEKNQVVIHDPVTTCNAQERRLPVLVDPDGHLFDFPVGSHLRIPQRISKSIIGLRENLHRKP